MAAQIYDFIDPFVKVTIKMSQNDLRARDIRDMVADAFDVNVSSAHAGSETEEKDCVTHTVYLSPGLVDLARCVLRRKSYVAAVVRLAASEGIEAEVKVRPYVYF